MTQDRTKRVTHWKEISNRILARTSVFSVMESIRTRGGRSRLFYTIQADNWVNVIPVTSDRKIVMVRQYRAGTETATLEIPGGMVGPHESPLEAAERELLEETGYGGEKWTKLGVVAPNPAIQNNLCYTYLLEDASPITSPCPDPGEEMVTVLLPLNELMKKIETGEIRHALVIDAFFWFFLRSGRIRGG